VRGFHLTASLSILLQACTSSPTADLGPFDAGAMLPARLGVDPHARSLRAGSTGFLLTATLASADGTLTDPSALLEPESEPRSVVTD